MRRIKETLRCAALQYANGQVKEEGVSKCTPSFFMHKAPTFDVTPKSWTV